LEKATDYTRSTDIDGDSADPVPGDVVTKTRCTWLFLAVVFLVAGSVSGTDTSQRLVLSGINVIDVRNGSVARDRCVAIEGRRIVRVAAAGAVEPGDDDLVVDGTGKYLMPGLWDMHVHLGEPGAANLGVLVAYGVTSVRDMGTPIDIIAGYRRAVARGAVGPRIKAPGWMITNPRVWALLEQAFPADMWQYELRRRISVGTPEEARAAVRKAKADGADFVKLHWNATPETYAALGDECRKQGLTFAGHDPLGGLTLDQIAAAGQRSIEHLDGAVLRALGDADDAERARLVALIRGADIHFVPTIVTFLAFEKLAGADGLEERLKIGESGEGGRYVTPEMEAFWRLFLGMYPQLPPPAAFEPAIAVVKMLHAEGVPIMPGTDLGAPLMYPGISLLDEMVEFVGRLGMTPAEALHSATVVPAEFFGMSGDLGAVEEGMLADLVVLEANPLESMANIRTVHSVVVGGRYVDADERLHLLESAALR